MSCRGTIKVPPPEVYRIKVPPPLGVVASPSQPTVRVHVPPPQNFTIGVRSESYRIIGTERVGPTGPQGPPGFSVAQILEGTRDGANLVFSASAPILDGSESVTVNGLEQGPGHYWILGAQVVFADAPEPLDQLFIRYQPIP